MSVDIGEAFLTISLQNDIDKKLSNVMQKTTKTVEAGEKKKQDFIKKTTNIFHQQSRSVLMLGNQFNQFMGSASKAFIGLSAVAIGGAVAMNRLITASRDFAQAQLKAEAVSGTSTVAIQKLSNAYSNLANVGIGQATSELSAFAQKIERGKMGLESPIDLMMGGVNFNKDTTLESAIADLRRNLGNRSTQEVSAFLERAGLSNDLLFVIKASSEELERFNSIPVLSKSQLQDIQGAGKSLGMLKQLIGGLIKTSQAQIAPFLRTELERIFKTVAVNKTKIVDFITATTKGISKFVTAIVRATGLIADFIRGMMESKVGFLAVAVGIGMIMKSTKPLWWALGGIIMLLEEIAFWKETGESPLSGLFEAVQKVYHFLDRTVGVANILTAGLVALGGASVISGITALGGALGGVATTLGLIAKNPLVLAGIGAIAGGKLLGKLGTALIRKEIEEEDEGTTINPEMVKQFNERQKGISPNALPPKNTSSLSQNSQMVNNNQRFTINIDGSNKNPSQIAKEVGNEIGRSYDFDMKQLSSLVPV